MPDYKILENDDVVTYHDTREDAERAYLSWYYPGLPILGSSPGLYVMARPYIDRADGCGHYGPPKKALANVGQSKKRPGKWFVRFPA